MEEHGKQVVKSSSEKEALTLLKQKIFFEELDNETINEIQDKSKRIDFNNFFIILYFNCFLF